MFLPACENCGLPSAQLFCKACLLILAFKNICISCGAFALIGISQCMGCRKKSWSWDELHASFIFSGGVRTWISNIKEGGRPERWRELQKNWIPSFDRTPEAIVYVPSDPISFRRRLYDPGEALAKYLSQGLQLPVLNLFQRDVFLSAQKKLHRSDRLRYFRETIKLRPITQRFRCLLLVDDVMTTGASLDRCSELLKPISEAVVVYCVARTLATKALI